MNLLSKFRKSVLSSARKQKKFWDKMQRSGYFSKYPAYGRWISRTEEPLPLSQVSRSEKKEIPGVLAAIDFSSPEVLFDPCGADPYKFFDEELDPALKLTEEIWLQKMMELDQGMTVLDIGCGFGRTEEWMADHVKEVYGVDISDFIIDVCKKRFSEKRNVHFYANSGYNLSLFEDSKFDFIYCFNVFQHIPRKFTEEYLREMKRTLKPGGIALFNMLSGINHELDEGPDDINWSIGYAEKDIDGLLSRAGLIPVKTFKWVLRNADSFWIWKLAGG